MHTNTNGPTTLVSWILGRAKVLVAVGTAGLALVGAGTASAASISLGSPGPVAAVSVPATTAVADTNTGSGSGGVPYPGDGFCEGMKAAAHAAYTLSVQLTDAGQNNAAAGAAALGDAIQNAAFIDGCPG